MTTADLINGSFELGGSIFTWMNAYRLYKDRQVKGVFSPAFIFFAIWGLWNLFYYPHLDQMLSFYAGIVLVAGNVLWCAMYFYLLKKDRKKRKFHAQYPLTEKECFILIISVLIAALSCKAPNKCNYNNKTGQGKYWHQGAKKNWHRL